MARAIIRGGLDRGVLDRAGLVVADPAPQAREACAALGVRAVEDSSQALDELRRMEASPGAGRVLLGVKPQALEPAARDLAPALAPAHAPAQGGPARGVVSILAGTPGQRVRRLLGESARVVRAMPNTPAQVGRGITALSPGPGATDDDLHAARALFAGVGEVIELREDLMDAFTALAGSGPAYVYYLAEAMERAGVALGFDAPTSAKVVRAVVTGSGALLDADPRPPADLRAGVTSPGGTTAAAVRVLDDAGAMDLVTRALRAARDRGRELGAG